MLKATSDGYSAVQLGTRVGNKSGSEPAFLVANVRTDHSVVCVYRERHLVPFKLREVGNSASPVSLEITFQATFVIAHACPTWSITGCVLRGKLRFNQAPSLVCGHLRNYDDQECL